MATWATPKQASKPQMRAIIAEEREVAGDDELREALAASRREADQLAARIVDAETAEDDAHDAQMTPLLQARLALLVPKKSRFPLGHRVHQNPYR